MQDLLITPGKLSGSIKVPPSKSMAHRAVICASLCEGESVVEGVELSDDIRATIGAMRALGAEIRLKGDTLFCRGAAPFREKGPVLVDCNESGSTLRFCVPIFAALGVKARYVGRGNLGKRPLQPYFDIFEKQGVSYRSAGDMLDLVVEGRLRAESFPVPGNVSSQFITGLMLALPLLGKGAGICVTTPLESAQYLDLTEAAMADFGVKILRRGKGITLDGLQCFRPAQVRVEGDYSQAAFFYVANALGSEIQLEGLRRDSLQGDRAALDILGEMGVSLAPDGMGMRAGKKVLHSTVIDGSDCPDIIPVLALAASLAKGTTHIIRAGRLRVKECDRLSATVQELSALGADIREERDGMVVTGVETLKGGTVWSHGDHRMAMMLAIAATCCEKPVLIKDYGCVSKSYAGFFEDYRTLGGVFHEQQL